MKRKILIGVSAVCVLLITVIACKRNFNDGFDARGTNAGSGPFKGTVTLPQVISANRTLSKDTLYILNGKTYVDSLVTLTIQAGGRIEGVKRQVGNNNDTASALIITRGAKLFAEGTSTNPIHFTSHEASPAPGDWGGIVLLGRAPLNRADTTIEGIQLPTVPVGINVDYGGGGQGLGDSMDCSGKLTYCIIEYAGAIISPDNELNGLTCGGVGAGTVLDFIEVYKGNDDAFEFFGGTVNAKHLVAFEPDDDAFDFDFGYNGKIQFAVSVLTPTASNYSANPNGIESDNNATGANNAPRTKAVLSNLTVIGLELGTDATSKGLFNGAQYRRASSYILRNSIVMGFPVGIRLESALTNNDSTFISNNIVHSFSNNLDTMLTSPTHNWTLDANNLRIINAANSNTDMKLKSPFGPTYDFRPDSTSPSVKSPALSWAANFSGLPSSPAGGTCGSAGFTFQTTSYIGAFPKWSASPANNWIAGWARLN